MIIYWLFLFARKIAWLFKPPSPRDVARIQKNATCPVCGANHGVLRAVQRLSAQSNGKGSPVESMLCQHTCQNCGARWWEAPIVKLGSNMVWPSVARTELERGEDFQRQMNPVAHAQKQQHTQ